MSTSSDFYVLTGASGNIGSKAAQILLSQGKKVRVVGRSASKLKLLADAGAEVFVATMENLDQMTRAFTGAKAIFAMIPPDYSAPNMRQYQNKIGEILAQAIQKSGVSHVVALSSLGAHLSEKTGPILGLHDQEKRLNAISNINILHLRPCYFMENQFANIGLIKSMNIAGSPLKPDVATPMIATQDIAAIVAQELVSLQFKGKTIRELLGPRDITMKEVTKSLGRAINKPDLPYIQFPYEEAHKAMVKMGMSDDAARCLVELQQSINEGFLKPEEKRGSSNTTPTTIDTFAEKVFAPAFKN